MAATGRAQALRLGQPINTLSGASQRLKLVRRLATASFTQAGPTLFLFDEPTTGLHFEDVRVLLGLFQRLVDSGHSVVVIEHQLDVIKAADWIIDMGPEGGAEGGRIVVAGAPEAIAACSQSYTGRSLRGAGAELISCDAGEGSEAGQGQESREGRQGRQGWAAKDEREVQCR
jgi:excinuclease UvrABC ATPase subunit